MARSSKNPSSCLLPQDWNRFLVYSRMSVRSSSAVLLFGACVAYFALRSYFHAYTVDDAYISLAAMTRPEGAPFALILVTWELARAAFEAGAGKRERALSRLRALLPGLLVFGIVFGGYFVWRYGFYGYLFPNTYYAKRATFSLSHVMNRLIEMRWFLVHLVPVGALAILGISRHRWARPALALVIVVYLAWPAAGLAESKSYMKSSRASTSRCSFLAGMAG